MTWPCHMLFCLQVLFRDIGALHSQGLGECKCYYIVAIAVVNRAHRQQPQKDCGNSVQPQSW